MAEETKEPKKTAKEKAPRALALDALRGFAILTMCLSGVVPWTGLPNWMYHAQYPRFIDGEAVKSVRFDGTYAGFTWVDLVFPMFLFAMGAAFPFALSSKVKKGVGYPKITLGIIGRGFALMAFAIYAQRIIPYQIESSPSTYTWFLALLGFLLLFPVYTRIPWKVSDKVRWITKGVGITAAFAFLTYLIWPDIHGLKEKTISTIFGVYVGKSDIIIRVLAVMAVFGSLVWILSQKSIALRLTFMLIGLIGHFLKYDQLPIPDFLKWNPIPWFYNPAFLKYLLIVIPGTIIGDILLDWMKSGGPSEKSSKCKTRLTVASLSILLCIVLVHTLLQARMLLPCLAAVVLTTAFPIWLFWKTSGKTDYLLKAFLLWGTGWLFLGVLVDAGAFDFLLQSKEVLLSEGGIKKDSSTPSYYFVSTGLSILSLLCLTIWIDLFGLRFGFNLLITNGQNPMIAYVGIRNLLAPVVNLTGLDALLFGKLPTPWAKFLWSLGKTLGLAYVVSLFTKFKIYWRT